MGEMLEFLSRFSSYSVSQLNRLLEDDEQLSDIICDMREIQEMQQTKEMTLASNRSIAEQNLGLQPSLDKQKMQLTNSYSSLQDLYESYQFRKLTLDHNSGKSSLDILLALLQAEGAKIEEETENMADSFLDGALSLDIFIEAYQNKRKLAHLRRVKIDKLQEVVLKCFQMPPASVNMSMQPQSSTSSKPLLSQVNGSAVPTTAPPPASVPPTGPQASLPCPEFSYCPEMPTMVPSYSIPLMQPYTPAAGSALPPRTGFIMQ